MQYILILANHAVEGSWATLPLGFVSMQLDKCLLILTEDYRDNFLIKMAPIFLHKKKLQPKHFNFATRQVSANVCIDNHK